jgi:hypothetical protein
MSDFTRVKMLCNWDSGDGLCRTWDKLTDGNCTYTQNNLSIKMVGDDIFVDNADYILIVNSCNFYPFFNDLIFLKMEPCFMDPFWRDIDKDLLHTKLVHGSSYNDSQLNNLEWHF